MITVYNFTRGVRGLRVAWQCEEMGLAYRAVGFEYPVPDDYRAKYPPGSVPFLEDDGGVAIGESIAMMLYLANRYGPTPLLPSAPAKLARVLELTVAAETSLGGVMNPMMATKFGAPDDQKANFTEGACQGQVMRTLDYIGARLDGDFLVGDDLTLADIAVSTVLGMWQGALGKDIPARLAAHRDRMTERPAYQKARAAFAVT